MIFWGLYLGKFTFLRTYWVTLFELDAFLGNFIFFWGLLKVFFLLILTQNLYARLSEARNVTNVGNVTNVTPAN